MLSWNVLEQPRIGPTQPDRRVNAKKRWQMSGRSDRKQSFEVGGRRKPGCNTLGEACYRGGLEEVTDEELDVERATDVADQPCRQQGVSTKLEEVFIDADPVHPQHLGKQSTQRLLLLRPRCPPHRRRQVRRRQRPPVELAVRGQRQAVQHHKRRRNHVVRKARLQRYPDLCDELSSAQRRQWIIGVSMQRSYDER